MVRSKLITEVGGLLAFVALNALFAGIAAPVLGGEPKLRVPQPDPARVDALGDALPRGSIARLGTLR
jgi:hypothetical protein